MADTCHLSYICMRAAGAPTNGAVGGFVAASDCRQVLQACRSSRVHRPGTRHSTRPGALSSLAKPNAYFMLAHLSWSSNTTRECRRHPTMGCTITGPSHLEVGDAERLHSSQCSNGARRTQMWIVLARLQQIGGQSRTRGMARLSMLCIMSHDQFLALPFPLTDLPNACPGT